MDKKLFSKNDNGFTCINCGFDVPPLGYTSRNHCPKCLCSLHVDVNPGDRDNDCKGILRPISALTDPKKGYIIVFKCDRCGEIRRNKAANDDDIDYIIKLTANQY